MSEPSDINEGQTLPSNDGSFRQLVLVKGEHRFVFRYEQGAEAEALTQMLELARDPDSDFDNFDAAVLSHQMGQQMSEQLGRLDKAS